MAGLNYRFQWTTLPETIVWIGVALFLLAYSMFGEVLRENRYLSRVIEVQDPSVYMVKTQAAELVAKKNCANSGSIKG